MVYIYHTCRPGHTDTSFLLVDLSSFLFILKDLVVTSSRRAETSRSIFPSTQLGKNKNGKLTCSCLVTCGPPCYLNEQVGMHTPQGNTY